MKKTKSFKKALQSFEATCVNLKVIPGQADHDHLENLLQQIRNGSYARSLPRTDEVSSLDKSQQRRTCSFDSSMMMSLDELHASVGKDGKIPGSIFGEVLLPSDPEEYWLRGIPTQFPENPYCTREQLHATFEPGSRPKVRSHLYINGELVLSYQNILYIYGHLLRKFIRIHGFPLPARCPVVGRYREDMNELLEYLLKVFPPFIEGHYVGWNAQPLPYRIVPFKDRPVAVKPKN